MERSQQLMWSEEEERRPLSLALSPCRGAIGSAPTRLGKLDRTGSGIRAVLLQGGWERWCGLGARDVRVP